MTIGNALTFIKQGLKDSQLRKHLNSASSSAELYNVLADERLTFSLQDFDQAFHLCLVKCQEEEDAEELKEFKMWWNLLLTILGSGACETQCATGCGS